MSVDIQLDIDAASALGKIGTVAAALKGLEQTADSVDLDLGDELSDVAEQLRDIKQTAGDIDVRFNQNGELEELKRELSDLDADVGLAPGGATGDGDSENDPPDDGGQLSKKAFTSLFPDQFDTDGGSQSDGGRSGMNEQVLRRLLGETFGIRRGDIGLNGPISPGEVGGEPDFSDLDYHELKSMGAKFGIDQGDNPNEAQIRDRLNRAAEKVAESEQNIVIDDDKLGKVGLGSALEQRQSDIGGTFSHQGENQYDPMNPTAKRLQLQGIDRRDLDLDKLEMKFSKFGGSARKLIPNIGMIYNAVAALLPILGVFATQLLGVASAMGAVAVAGAGIIGLGLLGHGDSMASSFANAKEELTDLAEASFEMAQPTMQQFAPIQARMFDAIPARVGQVADAMSGLTAYEDTLFQVGAMFANGLAVSAEAIADNEEGISQLALRFSKITGMAIGDLFAFLYREALKNQEMFVKLGSALKDLGIILFRVSKFVVNFIDNFDFLITVVKQLSGLLDNRLVAALLGATLAAYLTASAFTKLGLTALKAFGFMTGGSMVNMILTQFAMIRAGITRLIAHYTALSAAAAHTAAAMAMTGIGGLALLAGGIVGAGMLSGGGGGGGSPPGMGGGNAAAAGVGPRVYEDNRSYTINNEGSGDYFSQKSMEDTVKKVNRTEQAQQLPTGDN